MILYRPTPPARHRTSDRASGEAATALEQRCAERHLSISKQRRIIIEVLSLAPDHPTVKQVHHRAVALDPRISRATVYRTLALFEKQGLIRRLDFGDGQSRYEEASKARHDYLIDIETHAVTEFSNPAVEVLLSQIAHRLGFYLGGYRLELHGVRVKPKSDVLN